MEQANCNGLEVVAINLIGFKGLEAIEIGDGELWIFIPRSDTL